MSDDTLNDSSHTDNTSNKQRVNPWKIIFPLAVLILGAGTTAAIMSSREAPQRIERQNLGPLVETLTAQPGTVTLNVAGQGEVSPKTRVSLAPQVTGRVVDVHSSMVAGGRFRAGTVLFTIEPRDYELAVERARASIASAQTQLEREQLEADAARAEWQEVNGEKEPPSFLVRKPQIREAEARLRAAEADLASAELQLQRTRVSVPFDGIVIEESVNEGQLVAVGNPVATVFGTDQAEIRVPLDDAELAFFDLPSRGDGPPATISTDFAGARHTWEGRVDRLEGQIDPRSRMVRIVVTVDRPYASTEQRPPLLPGSFVDVLIHGREYQGVTVIPRHVVRGKNELWVAKDGKLDIRSVDILRSDRQSTYVRSGLVAGEQIVTSPMDAVTDGMTLRIAEETDRIAPTGEEKIDG